MSVNEAIELLESTDWMDFKQSKEIAAMLREAKEIIGYFVRDGMEPDNSGIVDKDATKNRAERWLKE